jgi:hypothetical protein
MSNSIKIDKVLVRDYKGITQAELNAGGNHVIVRGINGQGKSSFLDFCFGTTSKTLSNSLTHPRPSEMIRNGADSMEGTIMCTQGYEIQVKGKYKKDKQEMSVTLLRDGVEQKAPRALMDELFGVVNFDIDSFMRMSDKEQVKFYMNLIGVDFTDLEQQHSVAFRQRTDANRDLKKFEAEVSSLRLPLIGKEKPGRLDMAELRVQREAIEKSQREYDRIKGITEDSEFQVDSLDSQIADLRAQIQRMEADKAQFNEKAVKGRNWLNHNERAELDDVSTLVSQVYENNTLCDKFEELEKKTKLVEDTKAEIQQLENDLKDVAEQKLARLANAKHPVPGMEVTEDGLRLNGVPFAQINTAAKYVCALQMQMPLMGQARIARFVGDSIDAITMQQIGEMAEQHGLQLFIEQVDRDNSTGGIQFEIKERL